MGDHITDLSSEPELPPVPPKTYQWEDIRRQKLEGRYPWTHLYKPPFDLETYEKLKTNCRVENRPDIWQHVMFKKIMNNDKGNENRDKIHPKDVVCGCQYFPSDGVDTGKSNGVFKYEQTLCGNARCLGRKKGEHEYEPVIPMDTNRKTPPPFVKVTTEIDKPEDDPDPVQDKHHLCVPKSDIDDDEENDYEEQDYDGEDDDTEEITAAELQTRLEEKYFKDSPCSSKHDYELPDTRSPSPLPEESKTFQDKVQLQTDKIKLKLKNFKDQMSKDTPQLKRKIDDKTTKPVKKNKFNFRKHNIKLPDKSNFQLPQAPRLSFASLSSFSRSRSNSVKERERKQSSESDSTKKKFDFGTYPRIFSKKKKSETKTDAAKTKPKSAPGTPISRRSPFPQRWINKLTDKKDDDKKEPKKGEIKKETVVHESIFISLHEDVNSEVSDTPKEAPTKMELDNKNFIFISLHEERFPEKLKQQEEQRKNTENELESELKKVETARKFTSLLKRLETERKLKAKRFVDDKPEPVTITEITTDEEGENNNATLNVEDSVESPEDSEEHPVFPSEPPVVIEEYKERISQEKQFKEETPSTKKKLLDVFKKGRAKEQELMRTSAETSKEPSPDKKAKSETPASRKKAFFEASPISDSKPITPAMKRKEVTPELESKPETPLSSKKFIKEKTPETKSITSTPQTKSKESSPEIKSSTTPLGKRKKETSPSGDKKDVKKPKEPKESTEPKEPKESKEPKENKEPVNINTLKNKIKNIFSKDENKQKQEKSKTPEPSKEIFKHVAINESENQIIDDTVPHKAPRKKLKKLDSDKESKESLSAFEDPALNDIITLDEQQSMTKTYINVSLQKVNDIPAEPEHTTKHFKNYEKALEKSRSYSSIEIENNSYSTNNTLARLETPVPPSRPSRTRSLQRPKCTKHILKENKENVYDLDANSNYNTFPIIRPDRPRRKFRKRRTYSNTTSNTEVKSVNELEDAAISQNIANSKQLSISFLPLTSNIVGEPITNYNLRETSSMIHLNLNDPPPLPPKRRKSSVKEPSNTKYNTLPNRKFCSKTSSKTSIAGSETYNNLEIHNTDFDYADDVNSTIPSDSPPHRPSRKRSVGPSLLDEDRTSREIESLPSEKSSKDENDEFDSDSKDANGYAVIGKPQKSHSQPTNLSNTNTTPRRISRRLSDFFTLPRIKTPTNYVSSSSTLNYERRPSPSRPPRKSRPFKEPVYTNEENINATATTTVAINSEGEEELNFNLITPDDDVPEIDETEIPEKDKNLQSDDILEKMKARPLPPPPRPTRKLKDEKNETQFSDYSLVKKNSNIPTNNLSIENQEQKIINTEENSNKVPSQPVQSNEPEEPYKVVSKTSEFKEIATDKPSTSALNVITAERLNVSELNVAKLSIHEIESSKLVTSNVDTSTMQVSNIKSEGGHVVLNSVELSTNLAPLMGRLSPNLEPPQQPSRDLTPSSEEPIPETSSRSRISSMIPEVGSDEESNTAPRVLRPSRRKTKKEEPNNRNISESSQATLAELMCQILQICHSSVGQALHSLLEQVVPEDREKRNEVQAAIWVITIIVAGCLILGLQTNEKIVHHHHWDFHFPPPH